MRRMIVALCGATLVLGVMLSAAQAAKPDAASAKAAIAEAAKLQAHAMTLDDGWSTTEAALKQARAAYKKHDYATSLAKAQHATKLARISILQAESQKELWHKEVVQ